MISEKIIKEKYVDFFGKDKKEIESSQFVEFIQELNTQRLIGFTIEEKTADCDYWLQAETGKTVEGAGFIGFIFDFDIAKHERDIDDVVSDIQKLEKREKLVLGKIK